MSNAFNINICVVKIIMIIRNASDISNYVIRQYVGLNSTVIIQTLQEKLRSCLEEKTSGIVGKYSGEAFLNSFSIGASRITGSTSSGVIFEGEVIMTGEMMRPSLTGQGSVNIAYLFNNGYSARRTVYGYYVKYGVYARSLQAREGLHFVQDAVADFKAYCAGLGVIADVKYDSGFN